MPSPRTPSRFAAINASNATAAPPSAAQCTAAV